jgi:hypothetical protein
MGMVMVRLSSEALRDLAFSDSLFCASPRFQSTYQVRCEFLVRVVHRID